MRRIKRAVLLSAIAVVLVLSACLVYGYGSEANGSIGNLVTKGSNYISPNMAGASATTTTNIPGSPYPPVADTYVDATFYWENRIDDDMGTEYKAAGGQSASTVTPTGATNRLFYKVISNHSVWYGQGSWSCTNLTTIVPAMP